MELMDSLISYIQFCEDCLSEPSPKCRQSVGRSVGRIKLLLFSKSNLGRLLRWNSLILRTLCAVNALHGLVQQSEVSGDGPSATHSSAFGI